MDGASNLIDREYLSEVSGGDVDFEKELIQAFLDAAPDLIQVFLAALKSDDAAKATYAAHTLKGSSRSIGANSFAEVTENAEKAARKGDLHSCAQLALMMEQEFSLLEEAGAKFVEAA